MSIPAGNLTRRIQVQARNAGVDELNQPLDGWITVLTLWAQPKGETGMGAVRAPQEGITIAPGRYSWRIRYRPTGINKGMRLLHGDMIFDITDIRHDLDRHNWTDLVCETGANDG